MSTNKSAHVTTPARANSVVPEKRERRGTINLTLAKRSQRMFAAMLHAKQSASSLLQLKTTSPSTLRKGNFKRLPQRRSEIDTGPEDWPSLRDVGEGIPPPNTAQANIALLVDELRNMQVEVPSRGANGKARIELKPARVHLPTATEMQTLPQEMRRYLHDVGMETLRMFFLPLLLIRQKRIWRNRTVSNQQNFAPTISLDFISRQSIFRSWPHDTLELALKRVKFWHCDKGEYIVHEREPASAVFFLASGSVQFLRKLEKRNKHINAQNTEVVATYHAPAVFGELSLLTNEPWGVSVRTTAKADVWLLMRPHFMELLEKVPKDGVAQTIRVAFQRRNDTMHLNYPMDAATLRAHATFYACSDPFLNELVNKLEPMAVPTNYVLARRGEYCQSMYFLRQGSVGLFKMADSGEETHAQTLTPGNVIGDSALLHSAPIEFTARTMGDSDLWRLPKTSFQTVCHQYPSDVDHMLDAARAQRQEELNRNHHKFRGIINKIPFLAEVLPPYLVKDFLLLLVPKVYRALTSVCSTSSFCDRLIVLTKGRIRIGNDTDLPPGECIGWTCLVPHRWGKVAITLDTTVEVLEIPCEAYILFLQTHKLYNAILHKVKMVLFPNAFPKPDVEAMQTSMGPHVVTYPISRSRSVNLNEMMFCTVHMNVLAHERKVEIQTEAQRKKDMPPPYKELSRGFWIPKQKNVRGFAVQ